MDQSRLESLIEQVVNVGTGVILAYVIMHYFLAPALGIPITHAQNSIITAVLTVVSIARSYMFRRIFNKRMYKDWATWLRSKL